ncbi:hypothetical protein GUJ93_ZPchr0007g4221 [Zizania palustris]|uniref:Uncharacterized protein n=1 Tax=Zizania palustris TaxID=103762 RepID=A0A8J5W6J8_ZIZPA|nr:hypothetical protein GUJ93_ZPchr0007g4221 [Zizania palustris]
MSRFARSARRVSAAATLAILFGGLILLCFLVETSTKQPPVVSVLGVGGRKMMINGGLAHKTLEDFKADDPYSSMKRRVPNGPDPIHNRGTGESGRSPGRA